MTLPVAAGECTRRSRHDVGSAGTRSPDHNQRVRWTFLWVFGFCVCFLTLWCFLAALWWFFALWCFLAFLAFVVAVAVRSVALASDAVVAVEPAFMSALTSDALSARLYTLTSSMTPLNHSDQILLPPMRSA